MALFIAFKSYTDGKKISIGKALALTKEYTLLVLEWALFYSVVIMLIRIIGSRIRGIGGILIGASASLAIGVSTIFVVPIIYEQHVGPINAIKSSVNVFVKHFGSTVGGISYADLYGLGFTLGGLLILVLSFLSYSVLGVLSILGAFVGLILIVIGMVITSVISNIFKLILYDYASRKGLPEWLDKDVIQAAVKVKNGGSQPYKTTL